MTVVDNAVGLHLLEELCAELRTRLDASVVPQPKLFEPVWQVRALAKTAVQLFAILTSACLTFAQY